MSDLLKQLEKAADDEHICGVDAGRSGSCNVDYLLYDAVEKITALEALTQWQPIDTVPKDEMVLFAFDEAFFGTFTKEMQIGYYDSESEEWRFWLDERKVVGPGVTHWMPLPAPPKDE